MIDVFQLTITTKQGATQELIWTKVIAGDQEITMISMGEKLAERNIAKKQARLVGVNAAIEKQHREGKLTARERIEKLLDPNSFQELDLLLASAEDLLDPMVSGIPTDGVITGYGEGRSLSGLKMLPFWEGALGSSTPKK
jgi:acetyl-CoA carboxylase carboxyltransferase component